jgi:hypothetical protein
VTSRRGVAIAAPAGIEHPARQQAVGPRPRGLAALPSDHDEVGIERTAVRGAEEQKAVTPAHGLDPALRELAERRGGVRDRVRLCPQHDEATARERIARPAQQSGQRRGAIDVLVGAIAFVEERRDRLEFGCASQLNAQLLGELLRSQL